MGNFISKNHRIATAQRLAESVGEEWYGFIASPNGTDAVNSTDEVSLDRLSRQILAHAKINNDGFALMANYTPNADNNDLIALTALSYYGQKTDDDGSDVVIDYTDTLTLKVFKVLHIGTCHQASGTHIRINDFVPNIDEKEFTAYSSENAEAGTINIKYKHIGTINSDERGNFYLDIENIFPVRFNISGNPDNTNPGGVEWITAAANTSFNTGKYTGITDGVYPVIISGDGVSGKAEVTLNGSNIANIKVVDAGKYFKDATKLKLLYPDNSEVSGTIEFGKISPPEGHGISHTDDYFEMARQFSFVGLKFYTKISAGDLAGKISNGINFRTTGLFRKRSKIPGSVPVYNTSTNDGTSLAVKYKREASTINGNFTTESENVKITYVGDYDITENLYIKVDNKIFKIDSIDSGAIIIENTKALLSEYISGLTSGAGQFTVLEARGVGIANNYLQVIPNEDGVYQPFRPGTFKNINDSSTDERFGQASVFGKNYADIMSFDTKDGDSFHTWETGNNIYFSQIILL